MSVESSLLPGWVSLEQIPVATPQTPIGRIQQVQDLVEDGVLTEEDAGEILRRMEVSPE